MVLKEAVRLVAAGAVGAILVGGVAVARLDTKPSVTSVSNSQTTDGFGSVEVSCPRGWVSTGGGFFVPARADTHVTESYPVGKRGWGVQASSESPVEITVYARCVQ
jgi:hypothetical protein